MFFLVRHITTPSLVAQPSHLPGTLWLRSHCLRWLLASTPACHSGLAGHCCHATHLLLMVKWYPFDGQNLIIPKLRDPRAKEHLLSPFSYGGQHAHRLLRNARLLLPGAFLPEGSVRWRLVSHLIPSSGCPHSPGISSSFPAGQYQVQVWRTVLTARRGGGGLRCFTKMLSHTSWESAPCQQTSLYPASFSGRRCRSPIIALEASGIHRML